MASTKTLLPYNIDRWGQDYFQVNDSGELEVSLPGSVPVAFSDLAQAVRQSGLRLPVLLRFKSILHDRVNQLVSTFSECIQSQGYSGQYQVVYPIKVNQQRRVVEEIIASEPARQQGQVGLEAGSKPELLAVLALSLEPGSTIICNGYKDREYIRAALMGQLLGYKVCIVIEKASELPIILEEAKALSIEPVIGLRARLNSIGKGKWQNTGGEKSKFGLSSQQILDVIGYLQEQGKIESLKLLHFHLGSQIANIRDIQKGLKECAVIYAQLRQQGALIDVVDIGGGLGVDYDGTGSRNECSVNYQLSDYARTVVSAFKECCEQYDLPHPDLVSESGRALTAHHAVLMTNVVAEEKKSSLQNISGQSADTNQALTHLWSDYQDLKGLDANQTAKRSPIEIYHDAKHALEDIHTEFIHGHLGLEQQAQAEAYYQAICTLLLDVLDPQNRDHRELIDRLNEKLADKLFVNFSLFQSTPDIWGIDQIFPILPINGLNKPLTRRAIVQDITCDSDGRIDHYVSDTGLTDYLMLPESDPASGSSNTDLLCFFLVGAYQEILGDMHNLFGDTDSVDVEVDDKGEIKLSHEIRGDTVSSVLEYVNLKPETLLNNYRTLLAAQEVKGELYDRMMSEFESGLGSYTYLES